MALEWKSHFSFIVFFCVLIRAYFATEPFNWKNKAAAINYCCVEHLNASDFNAEFKRCFRIGMLRLLQETKKELETELKKGCDEDEYCIKDTFECIIHQQKKLRDDFKNTTFEKPENCDNYPDVVLSLWSKVISEYPCKLKI